VRSTARILAFSALIVAFVPDRTASAPISSEYQVKTAYLYNFAKFIQWPEGTFTDTTEAIVIGIVGEDPFGNLLDEAISQRRAQGRPLRVERYHNLADIGHCHLLFVSRSEAKQQSELFRALADSNVVTIGESPDFTKEGGQVRFFLSKSQTIKIEINRTAVHRAGIFISSRILKIARIYKPEDQPKAR
jgi:hypothetical protein